MAVPWQQYHTYGSSVMVLAPTVMWKNQTIWQLSAQQSDDSVIGLLEEKLTMHGNRQPAHPQGAELLVPPS